MKTPKLLDLPNVGEATARQLTERGLRTVKDVSLASIEKIRDIRGLSTAKASAVRQAAVGLLEEYRAAIQRGEVEPEPEPAGEKPSEVRETPQDAHPARKDGPKMAKKKDKKDDKKAKKKADKKKAKKKADKKKAKKKDKKKKGKKDKKK